MRKSDIIIILLIVIILLLVLIVVPAEAFTSMQSGTVISNNTWAGHNIIYNNTNIGKIFFNASIFSTALIKAQFALLNGSNFDAIYGVRSISSTGISNNTALGKTYLNNSNGLFIDKAIYLTKTQPAIYLSDNSSTYPRPQFICQSQNSCNISFMSRSTIANQAMKYLSILLETDAPTLAGNAKSIWIQDDLSPYYDNTYDLGSTGYYWRNISSYKFKLGNGSSFDVIYGARGTSSGGIQNNTLQHKAYINSTIYSPSIISSGNVTISLIGQQGFNATGTTLDVQRYINASRFGLNNGSSFNKIYGWFRNNTKQGTIYVNSSLLLDASPIKPYVFRILNNSNAGYGDIVFSINNTGNIDHFVQFDNDTLDIGLFSRAIIADKTYNSKQMYLLAFQPAGTPQPRADGAGAILNFIQYDAGSLGGNWNTIRGNYFTFQGFDINVTEMMGYGAMIDPLVTSPPRQIKRQTGFMADFGDFATGGNTFGDLAGFRYKEGSLGSQGWGGSSVRRHYGIIIDAIGSGANSIWGGLFANDLQVTNNTYIILEGNTTRKGDTKFRYNSNLFRIDTQVDGVNISAVSQRWFNITTAKGLMVNSTVDSRKFTLNNGSNFDAIYGVRNTGSGGIQNNTILSKAYINGTLYARIFKGQLAGFDNEAFSIRSGGWRYLLLDTNNDIFWVNASQRIIGASRQLFQVYSSSLSTGGITVDTVDGELLVNNSLYAKSLVYSKNITALNLSATKYNLFNGSNFNTIYGRFNNTWAGHNILYNYTFDLFNFQRINATRINAKLGNFTNVTYKAVRFDETGNMSNFGRSKLSGGHRIVATSRVTPRSMIFLQRANGTSTSSLSVQNITAGLKFGVKSSGTTDNAGFFWMIVEPI